MRSKLVRLRREVGDRADVFPLIQRTEATQRALAIRPDVEQAARLFDVALLPGFLGYPYFKGALVPGSAHFPVLAFFKAMPHYDFYFLVEHDVEFTGDWGELVERATQDSPDFVSSHVATYETGDKWTWWNTYVPADRDRGWAWIGHHQRRSFNPLYFISNRGLSLMHEAHRTGWRGHHEVLFATILTYRGCKVVDFAELGEFYVGPWPPEPGARSWADHSTVRWRPEITLREFVARSAGQMLFHPVKARWTYDGSRIVVFRNPPRNGR